DPSRCLKRRPFLSIQGRLNQRRGTSDYSCCKKFSPSHWSLRFFCGLSKPIVASVIKGREVASQDVKRRFIGSVRLELHNLRAFVFTDPTTIFLSAFLIRVYALYDASSRGIT